MAFCAYLLRRCYWRELFSWAKSVLVSDNAILGNSVKVQNNVAIYGGVTVEDDVFLGPSCVLTNVTNPRSQVVRRSLYEATLIKRGATIGANATIVCGITLGKYCFVGAGAVVTKDVPDYGLILGNPGRLKGYMSRHGHPCASMMRGRAGVRSPDTCIGRAGMKCTARTCRKRPHCRMIWLLDRVTTNFQKRIETKKT